MQRENAERELATDKIRFSFNLEINNLGLSLIGSHENERAELFFVSSSRVVAMAITSKQYSEYQVVIQNISVDKQYSGSLIYPILMTSRYKNVKSDRKLQDFLNCHVIVKNADNSNLLHLDTFELSLSPVCVMAEFQIINFLVDQH